MAGVKDTIIRVPALDGTWETIGVDRLTSVAPENVSLTTDTGGPSAASFDLRRSGRSPWPDIGAFTPVEAEVGGVLVWDGRVKEAPVRDGTDRVMSVQCEGWQAHLDDDVLVPYYVHTRLGEYKDARSFAAANLTQARQSGNVSNDNGVITLGWPATETLKHNDMVGVVLDLGPDSNGWLRIVVEWESSNNISSALQFVARGSDQDYAQSGGSVEDAFVIGGLSGASGITAGSIVTGRRYVHLFLYWFAADMGAPLGADAWWKIKAARAFGQTAYESANASALKASSVVSDALNRGAMLLSSDRSQIQATSFSIPDFASPDARTPREVIGAANAYHDYLFQVPVGRVPVFRPKPAAPVVEVGEFSSMEFEDASANSGEDIYNHVRVTAQTPSGTPLAIERSAAALAPTTLTPDSTVAAVNPSFTTNATGWTGVTRDTSKFDTSPASGSLFWGPGAAAVGSMTGTMKAGITYVVQVRVSSDSTATIAGRVDGASGTARIVVGTGWDTLSITVTPTSNLVNPTLTLYYPFTVGPAVVITAYIDSVSVYTSAATLVDRRKFRRTKILQAPGTALPDDGVAAAQLGDVWLGAHMSTPFKGTATLTGDGSVRNPLNGTVVGCERLLLMTGELLRFSDRSDPDTGGHGRDGRIAQVTYTPADDKAVVQIDNLRGSVDAFFARLAVVTGGG